MGSELFALARQFTKFALVGVAATAVYVTAYAGAVAFAGVPPMAANLLGFALGINVSFLGHRSWTFRGTAGSLARFWAVALAGFVLNSLFVYLVTQELRLGYGWAIPPIVAVTPIVTFLLSRRWAFRG